jgi:hypothetical protein
MTIGADPTINPELILQGLATTDPSLLVSEMNQTRQTNNQSALIPSEISKNTASAAYEQALANYNQMLISSWPALGAARKQTKQNAESINSAAPPPVTAPIVTAPLPPQAPTSIGAPNLPIATQINQPIADNSIPSSINTTDPYSTGLES